MRFNDYFFYPIKDIDQLNVFAQHISINYDIVYTSMYNVKMYKVQYFNYEVKKAITSVEQMFKKAYSLDIKPQIKYILDNKLQWSLKRNMMFFDIQTWYNPDFDAANKPEYVQEPITSIQLYSNVNDKYYVIV